jgi:hypothetical protein
MNRAYRISPYDTAGQDFGANSNTSRSETFTPRQIAIRQGMFLTGNCTRIRLSRTGQVSR